MAEAVSDIRKRHRAASEITEVREAITLKRYGFLVLVESAELRDRLRADLSEVLGKDALLFL